MNRKMTNIDTKYQPTSEYCYFVCDPDDGFSYYRCEYDQMKAAEAIIDNYLDDGEWYESVEQIIMGKISHRATQTDLKRPKGNIDDDTREDEAGVYWQCGIDYTCKYEMKPIKQEVTPHA